MAAKLSQLLFKSTTKLSTTNSLSARLIGNSNDYGQLKSIDNNSDNYSRSMLIATAIRNRKSSPTTSDGRIQRQRKPTTDDRVRQSTINMHRQRTTIASRLTYLLSVASLSISNMADSINDQTTIDNKNYLPRNQRSQSYSCNRNG